MGEDLLRRALTILEYCRDPEFNATEFKVMVDKFNSIYKRTSISDQGHYHQLFAEAMKG